MPDLNKQQHPSPIEPEGPRPTTWWEWPFVVAFMPLVFLWRLVKRAAGYDHLRPLLWIWDHLLHPPLHLLRVILSYPWRGLCWLGRQIRQAGAWAARPIAAACRWVRGLGAKLLHGLDRGVRLFFRTLWRALYPVRWLAARGADAGRWVCGRVDTGIHWIGRQLRRPVQAACRAAHRTAQAAGRALSWAGRGTCRGVRWVGRQLWAPLRYAYGLSGRLLRAIKDAAVVRWAARVITLPLRALRRWGEAARQVTRRWMAAARERASRVRERVRVAADRLRRIGRR